MTSCGLVMQNELIKEVTDERLLAFALLFITKFTAFIFALLLKLHPDLNEMIEYRQR